MLLEDVLKDIGFASIAFDNASSALTHLVDISDVCTLLIVDQGLPGGINGCEFIELAKKHFPSVHSILTSGHVIDIKIIPNDTIYLHKPYTLDQLEAAIAANPYSDKVIEDCK